MTHGNRERARQRLALAFAAEAVNLSMRTRPWARLDEFALQRYVTEADRLLRAEVVRRDQQRSAEFAFGV